MKRFVLFCSLLILIGISLTPAHAITITSAFIQPHGEGNPGSGFAQFAFDVEPVEDATISRTYSGQQLIDGTLELFTFTIVSKTGFIDIGGVLTPIFDITAFNTTPNTGGTRCDAGLGLCPEGLVRFLFNGFIATTLLENSPTLGAALGVFDGIHAVVSWGDVPPSVPEGGSTLLLLALSLSIVGLFARTSMCRKTKLGVSV